MTCAHQRRLFLVHCNTRIILMSKFTKTASGIPVLLNTLFENGQNNYFRSCALTRLVVSCSSTLTVTGSGGFHRSLSLASTSTCSRRTCHKQIGSFTKSRFVRLLSTSPFWIRGLCTSIPLRNRMSSIAMDLKEVLCGLELLAPTSLAETWDNVGLLVEPTPPHCVHTMILTNDLTEEVLKEAIKKKCNLILSYHPPIFTPLKRLTMSNTKERIIVSAIEKRIAIFSPHTSFDAVAGGVNDWLAQCLEPCKVEPLNVSKKISNTRWSYKVEYLESDTCTVSFPEDVKTFASPLTKIQTLNGFQCTIYCTEQGLLTIIKTTEALPDIQKTLQVTKLEKLPIPGTGIGRLCKLEHPVSVATLVKCVKQHLGLQHVQLALGSKKSQESLVQSVAICAGSGASVLSGVLADVYLTGEMSHHDILAAVARGTSVILCNHSNTERGYLKVLKSKLEEVFDKKINIHISEVDADPLNVV